MRCRQSVQLLMIVVMLVTVMPAEAAATEAIEWIRQFSHRVPEADGGDARLFATSDSLSCPVESSGDPDLLRDAIERSQASHRAALVQLLRSIRPIVLEKSSAYKARMKEIARGDGFYAVGGTGAHAVRQFFHVYAQMDPAFDDLIERLDEGVPERFSWEGSDIESVVDFDRQLQKEGIDLILLIHPSKVETYPHDWISTVPSDTLIFPEVILFVLALMDAGVEVIYLTPDFLQAANAEPGMQLFSPDIDVHWTVAGKKLAAGKLAERLARYDFTGEPTAVREEREVKMNGEDLYAPDPESPVIIAGDSFVGTGPPERSFHAYVTRAIGRRTGALWTSGGTLDVPRLFSEMGRDYIEDRQVLVWLIGTRNLEPLHRIPIAKADLSAAASAIAPEEASRIYVLIEEVSTVPDPATSLYADAITIATVRIRNVEKGPHPAERIRIARWVMDQRRLQPAARMRPGQSMRLNIVPFNLRVREDPGLETIQRTDDTSDPSLPLYWAEIP